MKALVQSQILKKTTKILAQKGIEVHTEGFAPRVEYNHVTKQPERIFIPEIPDGASDQLIAAIHGFIDHECGHILESNAEDICDGTKNQLWHYIHNCIEDPRVNAKMSERYPGCEANIRNGYNFLFSRADPTTGWNPYDKDCFDKLDWMNADAIKDAQVNYSSLWFAKKSKCRFSSAKYDELEAERLFDPLEAKMDPRYLDALKRAHTAEEVKEATDYFVEFFHKEFDEGSSGKGDPSEGEGKPADPSSTKHTGRLEDPKMLEEKLADSLRNEIEHLAKGAKRHFYFSDRYDIIHNKHDMVKGRGGMPVVYNFEQETKMVTNYLSKDLRRLLEARQRRWYTGGYKSGKLNQKVLHSVRLGNDRIFSKKNEIKHVKAAVSLLIDMSGSMGGRMSSGKDDKSKIYIATQSAYAFAMVLEQLKVPYEIWGFSTNGSNSAKLAAFEKFKADADPAVVEKMVSYCTFEDFYAFKTFDQNFDLISKSAMVKTANSEIPMQNNEDSIHVMKALERLGARPEEKKTLFVFSDGQPAFAPGRPKLSQEMLKYLDANAKQQYGVDIFGIGIMSDAVQHYYRNYKVVHKLEDLPSSLFEFLKTRI